MDQTQQKRILWETPLRRPARTRKQTPEAWHAEVLKAEAEHLVFLLRALEFHVGFKEGEHSGFHQGVNANALALRAFEAQPGETA